jgi:proteasome assembly chaperone (PAC2) family protein
MKNSILKYLEKPILKDPILIVGLPGVGNLTISYKKLYISIKIYELFMPMLHLPVSTCK